MSKLLEALKVHELGRVSVAKYPDPYLTVDTDIAELKLDQQIRVKVEARLAAVAYIPEWHAHHLADVRRKVHDQLNEHLFGEYRPMLLEVRRLLMAREYPEAERAVRKIHERMFGS